MNVAIRNLSKSYGPKCVLQNVDLTVTEGEFVALLGESGCGKTTLLSAIAGLIPVDTGTIALDGTICTSTGTSVPPEERNIGMVFQDAALWPHMTVFQNVAFGLKVRGVKGSDQRSRVAEVLRLVRMEGYETRYPHQLSGGQRQRIGIARALAPGPSLLLMDEPLSNLDAKLRQQMRWELLRIIESARTTTVFVTHDQSEALSMADRVVLLNRGTIEQEGRPTDLYREPRSRFAASFLGGTNLIPGKIVRTGNGIHEIACESLRLRARGPNSDGTVYVMIRPNDIRIQSATPLGGRTAESVGEDRSDHEVASVVSVRIVQRAFLGASWQYVTRGTRHQFLNLEVWSADEHTIGSEVQLVLPADICRIVDSSRDGSTGNDGAPDSRRERVASS